ncbi:MAG: YncE family protein, partial [Caldilineaceae bacterium]|nr:YncE family protein [Caldilineaceae bacterium]
MSVLPNAGGLAISADGKTLVVANNYNDSISVIDTVTATVRYEHDLRPFFANNEGTNGVAGGTFPFAVAIKGNGTAYVSANRDREIVVVDISSAEAGKLIKRVKLNGNPLGMTLDAAQKKLYVAQDNSDEIAVIDTTSNKLIADIDTRAPVEVLAQMNNGSGDRHTGVSPFAVTISPDGKTLYAVNEGANSVAVIPLSGARANKVIGLIPTAYAPRDISFSADGSWMYIINGKSVTGPNPGHLFGNTASLTSSTYPDGEILDANGEPVAPVQTPTYPLGDSCGTDCKNDNATAVNNARATNQYQFQLEQSS